MANNKKAEPADKLDTAPKSLNGRFKVLAGRVLAILEQSGIGNDELVTIRISVTGNDGVLLKHGIVKDLCKVPPHE